MSASMTAIQGGSTSDIFQAGLRGAVTGAITAGLTHGIGSFFDGVQAGLQAAQGGTELSLGVEFSINATKAAVHGAVHGGIAELDGGSFKDGFIGAAVGSVIGGGANHWFKGNAAASLAASALAGGTAAEMTGGKFANGAISAAFVHLFNDLAHQIGTDIAMRGVENGSAVTYADHMKNLTQSEQYFEEAKAAGLQSVQVVGETAFDLASAGQGKLGFEGLGMLFKLGTRASSFIAGSRRGAMLATKQFSSLGLGYRSRSSFIRAMGTKADHQWHHLVQARRANIDKYGPYVIHSQGNMVQIPTATHRRITAFQNSIPTVPDTGGMTFYNWVGQKPFHEQMEWGRWLAAREGVKF